MLRKTNSDINEKLSHGNDSFKTTQSMNDKKFKEVQ